MTVLDAIRGRRSIREYADAPVPPEDIEQLIDAARWAPYSTGTTYPLRFIAVTDSKQKDALCDTTKFPEVHHFIAAAPVVICIISDESAGGSPADAYAATLNLILAATELELGTCWVQEFNPARVAEILKLPEKFAPAGLITVGIPAEEPPTPMRPDLSDLLHWNAWGNGDQ